MHSSKKMSKEVRCSGGLKAADCGNLCYQTGFKVIGFVIGIVSLYLPIQIYSLPFLVLLHTRDDFHKLYHSGSLPLCLLMGIAQKKAPTGDGCVEVEIV